jgi:carbon storage regulator
MLVLSQRPGDYVLIGDSIKITTIRIGPGAVRYGVDAPKDMPIVRSNAGPLKPPTKLGEEHDD